MIYCIKCIVKGRVQGVFFRASTQQKANVLNLTGHAFNLVNGDVEVVACGNEEDVKKLQEWLWEGPEYARVDSVVCEIMDGDVLDDFVTG